MKIQRIWEAFLRTGDRFFQRVGIEGLFVFLIGSIVLGISMYDILLGSQINPSILVAVLSLFLIEISLQRYRYEKAKEEIISSLKGVQVKKFIDDNEFADEKYKTLVTAKNFVFDMELCKPKLSSLPEDEPESDFRILLNERVTKKTITFKYVEVIYDRLHFESVLHKVFKYYKYQYYVGCFVGAPDVIPALNIMIFDDKHFYVGGHYGSAARGESRNLHIQHDEIGQTLRQYFDHLWSDAKKLNERSQINWGEIRYCAEKLGYSISELNETIAKVAEQVGLKDVMIFK